MGRGRQRAKQRKVARDLKYFSPETDYAALERELTSGHSADTDDVEDEDDWEDYDPSSYEVPPATDDWDEDDWASPKR